MEVCRRTDSERFSRRLLPKWTELGSLLLLAAGGAWAQPAETPADGLALLESFLADVRSLSADFRQEIRSADADQRLLSRDTGTLALQRPNRFRWTSREPTELVVVADGEQVWTYDVELAQVTKAPLDESITSSPAMLLSGDRSVSEGFDVEQAYELDGLHWVKLVPKADGTDFSSVSIGFDGHVPKRLEFTDGLNQTTRIDLDNVVVNPELAADVFEFEPPPGADVI